MLFQSLLGAAFESLPPALQSIHDNRSVKTLTGQCDIERGRHWLAPLFAAAASLPPSGTNVPVTVTIAADAHGETWQRNFAGHAMTSRLWRREQWLMEKLGLVTFRFQLSAEDGRIHWQVAGASVLGVPLPASWFAQTMAEEFENDARYRFDVQASLPIIGPLIRYRGWLVEEAAPSDR